MNTVKTKVIVGIRGNQNKQNINISHKANRIKWVNQLKYFRSIVGNDERSGKEIKSRIGQAKKALLKVNIINIKKCRSLTLRKRKCFIKSYVWSTTLYENETRTLNNKDVTTLEILEMWYWRKMKKIKFTKMKTKNTDLRFN